MAVNKSDAFKCEVAVLSDKGESNATIASRCGTSRSTIGRIMKEYRDGTLNWVKNFLCVEDEPELVEEPQTAYRELQDWEVQVLVAYRIMNLVTGRELDFSEGALVLAGASTDTLRNNPHQISDHERQAINSAYNTSNDGLADTGVDSTPVGTVLSSVPEITESVKDCTNKAPHRWFMVGAYAHHESTLIPLDLVDDILNIAKSFWLVDGEMPLWTALMMADMASDEACARYGIDSQAYRRRIQIAGPALCTYINDTEFPFDDNDIEPLPEIGAGKEALREEDLSKAMDDAPFDYIIDDNVIAVTEQGKAPVTMSRSHQMFDSVRESLVGRAWDRALELITPHKLVENFESGEIKVDAQTRSITFAGEPVDGRLSTRIIDAVMNSEAGFAAKLAKLMENIDSNPSNQIVSRIYDFLAFNDLEITDDGCIMAFKVVGPNYTDKYTGKMDNSVGKTVTVKRHSVDENMDNTCSYGLHVCSLGYVGSYSGNPGSDRVLSIKMDPRDVVAIPRDYNNAKVRCCKYEVVSDVTDAYLRGNIKHDMFDHHGNKISL